METQFYILLTMKTVKGFESFAKFFIGNNREKALAIFKELNGTAEVSEKNILYVDFMETVDNMPMNLDVISCSLDQLAENCKIITKEVFISQNFD